MGEALYKAVSLFSGAGGMDIGFARAGIVAEVANDIDAQACSTYSKNHKQPILQGGVNTYLSDLARYRGTDFVFGGPPCQGFSVAGKMDPDDERSALIHTFLDVVDSVQPRAFVCENVKALASLSRWQSVRNALIGKASKNYMTAIVVLSSQDYGVPQNRERMFLFGFHRDEAKCSRALLESRLFGLLQSLRSKPQRLKDIVLSLGKAGSIGNQRMCGAKITFAKVPVLRRSAYAGMLFNGAGRPLPAAGHSSTLPASMGGNKTPIVDEAVIFDGAKSFVEQYHAHLCAGGKVYSGEAPSHLRRLTVDECIAIQTFPPNYAFSGSQSAIYRQIGNAVPCNMAEAVARAAVAFMQGHYAIDKSAPLAAE